MQTKLTLRVNLLLIKRAKSYAKQHGKSVSQIVGDYFALLNHAADLSKSISDLPTTKSLRGSLKGMSISEKNYKHYLEKKYL